MHVGLQLSFKDNLSQNKARFTVCLPHVVEYLGEILVRNTETFYNDKPLKLVKIEKNGPRDKIREFSTLSALIFELRILKSSYLNTILTLHVRKILQSFKKLLQMGKKPCFANHMGKFCFLTLYIVCLSLAQTRILKFRKTRICPIFIGSLLFT